MGLRVQEMEAESVTICYIYTYLKYDSIYATSLSRTNLIILECFLTNSCLAKLPWQKIRWNKILNISHFLLQTIYSCGKEWHKLFVHKFVGKDCSSYGGMDISSINQPRGLEKSLILKRKSVSISCAMSSPKILTDVITKSKKNRQLE